MRSNCPILYSVSSTTASEPVKRKNFQRLPVVTTPYRWGRSSPRRALKRCAASISAHALPEARLQIVVLRFHDSDHRSLHDKLKRREAEQKVADAAQTRFRIYSEINPENSETRPANCRRASTSTGETISSERAFPC